MRNRLDDLGRRAVAEVHTKPPSHRWLEARRSRRRNRRRLGVGLVGLVLVGGGLVAVQVGRSSSRPQAIETADTTISDTATSATTISSTTVSTLTPPPTTGSSGTGFETADRSRCGPWPAGLDPWPDRPEDQPTDTVDEDGRSYRRQSAGDYTLEIVWPPPPRVEYDLDAKPMAESPLDAVQVDSMIEFRHLPDGWPDPGSLSPEELEAGLGIEVMRVAMDDPSLTGLEGECANFEFRLFEGETPLGSAGFGFGSLGQEVAATDDLGQEFRYWPGVEWLELGPIVTEQRRVDRIPESITCDGVLVEVETVTYRVDGTVAQETTLADAIASGHFTEVTDPLARSATAADAETWAVVLPGAEADRSLLDLNQQGLLAYIDATGYEDHVDPETGPTAGPGAAGDFDRPIDALQAFFATPAAETFITSGLVELLVDETTYAYGVPFAHGRGGWVTVITVENGSGGWRVTGWTSAGC